MRSKDFYSFLSKISKGDSKEELFEICYEYCNELLSPLRARVYFYNDTKDFLICHFCFGSNINIENVDPISSNQKRSIVVRTAVEGTAQIIEDANNDQRVDARIMKKLDINSILSVPIFTFNSTIGVISFDFKEKTVFDEENLDKILTFIKMTCLLLENWELKDKVGTLDREFKKEIEKKSLELDKVNQQLLLSGRLSALGQLASGVAHEIKNPLAIIKMLIDMINNEMPEKDKFKNDVTVIKTEIVRLEEIVNHFLDFARVKKAQKTLEDINNVIKEVINFLKIRFESTKLIFELYPSLIKIPVDKNQIKQVFINIILNAVEACKNTPDANIKFKSSIISKQSGQFVKIDIIDNGPGIKEDLIDRIFEPFATTREDGLGLGLSITYRIVTNHDGFINVKNSVSGGAIFEILLPVKVMDSY